MRIQAFQEQAEIHRRARKGWIGALSCIPWPIPRSRGAQPAYMGSKWLRFFRVMHHLSKKSTPLETGRRQGVWTATRLTAWKQDGENRLRDFRDRNGQQGNHRHDAASGCSLMLPMTAETISATAAGR